MRETRNPAAGRVPLRPLPNRSLGASSRNAAPSGGLENAATARPLNQYAECSRVRHCHLVDEGPPRQLSSGRAKTIIYNGMLAIFEANHQLLKVLWVRHE